MYSGRKRDESQSIFRLTAFLSIFVFVIFYAGAGVHAQDKDVPYVPTPDTVVKKMLELANVGEGDYVIDLGSGDGRIVIKAAQFGAFGHGVEIDPERIKEARENARDGGVEDRVIFLKEDLFKTEINNASVITLYLLQSVNKKLRPKLLEKLDPGTRVVSHRFSMGDWKADRQVEVMAKSNLGTQGFDDAGLNLGSHDLYMWVIPADVSGPWKWTTDSKSFNAAVRQQYQEVSLSVYAGNNSWDVKNATLRGKRINFITRRNDTHYVYSGEVEKDTIKGTVQIHKNGEAHVEKWKAVRK